ncbi:hypothetical protein KR054_001740, partial [Drosophila jambulina]
KNLSSIMNLWLLIIQILIFLVSGNKSVKVLRPKNVVPPRCEFMLQYPQTYERMCHGSYPMVAFTKYRDTLVKVGEPYTMYISMSLENVLVVQKKSPLHDCYNLQFKDSNTFHCLDTNHNRTVSLDQANMFCFPFHIQLPDDLMNECLIENKMVHHHHKLDQIVGTKRAIVHYTYIESGAQYLRIPKLLPHPSPLHLVCLLVIVNFNVLQP